MTRLLARRGYVATPGLFEHTRSVNQKFHGTFDELRSKLSALGIDGEWEDQPNRVRKFKCKDRAGVLWSETKGTIWYDGPEGQKRQLAQKVEAALFDGALPAEAEPGSQIFVVHGRDHDSRDQLELVLRRLGLICAQDHGWWRRHLDRSSRKDDRQDGPQRLRDRAADAR